MNAFACSSRSLRRAVPWIAIALAVATAPAMAQGQPQGMAIPAYFSLDNGHDDWINLLTAGAVAKIVVLDMSVLGSGSGLNDCTKTPNTMIDCLHANGTLVLGYVNADPAKDRPSTDCRTVDQIMNQSNDPIHAGVGDWYPAYNVDGIFFDNVAPGTRNAACFDQGTYETIFNRVHTEHAWNHLGPNLCNGDACVMINMSQYEQRWPLASSNGHADFAVTYERPTSGKQYTDACRPANSDGQRYFGPNPPDEPWGFCPRANSNDANNCASTMNPNDWYFSADYGPRTAHVLRQNSSTGATDLNTVIAQSQSYHAGFLYIGHELCEEANGAQYSFLTTYYATLKSALGRRLTVDRTNANTNSGWGKVTSFGNGIKCDGSTTNKCDNLIAKNASVELVAEADLNSSFDGFVDGNNSSLCGGADHCLVTMSADRTIRAVFSNAQPPPKVALTADKAGSGVGTVTSSPQGISCGPTCTRVSYSFDSNILVTLTATPDANSRFAGFTSNCVPVSGNPTQCRITMSAAATVTTTFTATKVLTVKKLSTGTGTVSSSPAGISCVSTCASASSAFDTGVTVTLTAAPAGSSTFDGFSANCAPVSGVPTQCRIAMSAAAEVTAARLHRAFPASKTTMPACGTPPLRFTRRRCSTITSRGRRGWGRTGPCRSGATPPTERRPYQVRLLWAAIGPR